MKNKTAPEMIYERIRQQILDKKLFPGSHIVEDNIARDTGVSRTAVRGVMNRLQNDGYIKIIPNKGSYVINPTVEEIKMLYNTRLYLELGAASLAIRNVTPEIIARMESNYEAQKRLKSRFSITGYAYLNRDFHWCIAEANYTRRRFSALPGQLPASMPSASPAPNWCMRSSAGWTGETERDAVLCLHNILP